MWCARVNGPGRAATSHRCSGPPLLQVAELLGVEHGRAACATPVPPCHRRRPARRWCGCGWIGPARRPTLCRSAKHGQGPSRCRQRTIDRCPQMPRGPGLSPDGGDAWPGPEKQVAVAGMLAGPDAAQPGTCGSAVGSGPSRPARVRTPRNAAGLMVHEVSITVGQNSGQQQEELLVQFSAVQPCGRGQRELTACYPFTTGPVRGHGRARA